MAGKHTVQVLIAMAAVFVLLLIVGLYDRQNDNLPEAPTGSHSGEASAAATNMNETDAEKKQNESILALRKQYNNNDIIGRLRIEGTPIDYPVTQTDNNEFYLDYNIHQNKDVAGSIFMDFENEVGRQDKNTVIYGHNMKKNIMFHSLRYYQSEDFYRDHQYIVFDTLYEEQVWQVFSFYETDTGFPYIQVIFPTSEDFFELALEMKARSLYDTGVNITKEDRVLTLSTCSGSSDDTRYVLNARLLKQDELAADISD